MTVFGLFERDAPGIAGVYFPGAAPPPAEAFHRLGDAGYRLAPPESADAVWALRLDHPQHGEARLLGQRDSPPISDYTTFANNLTTGEKAQARDAGASVWLEVPARRRHVLRDRKTLLRIARDVMEADGVIVLDLASQLPWSRAALADELAHDADLDIEALYSIHAVHDGDEPAVDDDEPAEGTAYWLHTHGLGELGAFDFDVVAPHPAFVHRCGEVFRAIAGMVLAGSISPDQGRFRFGHPHGEARLVRAADFRSRADPRWSALRDDPDHDQDHSVLCEPGGRRLFGLGNDRPEPLRFPRREPPDEWVAFFSSDMTALMAERAAATIGVLRAAMEEFTAFEPTALVKIGYPTRSGGTEHLWFSANAIGETTLEATLESQPFDIPDLKPGSRAEHPLERISDWVLVTPAGQIHPRSQTVARTLREHGPEILAAMAEHR